MGRTKVSTLFSSNNTINQTLVNKPNSHKDSFPFSLFKFFQRFIYTSMPWFFYVCFFLFWSFFFLVFHLSGLCSFAGKVDGGSRTEEEEKVYSWLYTLAQSEKNLVFEYVRSTERGKYLDFDFVIFMCCFCKLFDKFPQWKKIERKRMMLEYN